MVAMNQQAIQRQQDDCIEDNNQVTQKYIDGDVRNSYEQEGAQNRRTDKIVFEIDAPVQNRSWAPS